MKYDTLSFAQNTRDNAAGICQFQFVPKEWLDAELLPSIEYSTLLEPISLVSGKSWLTGKPAQDTTGFTEEQVDSEAGIAWQQRIRFEVFRDLDDISAILNSMALREFVVIYTDNNGYKKVIGSKAKGASPLGKLVLEPNFTGKNGFTLELQHESDQPAPFYPF